MATAVRRHGARRAGRRVDERRVRRKRHFPGSTREATVPTGRSGHFVGNAAAGWRAASARCCEFRGASGGGLARRERALLPIPWSERPPVGAPRALKVDPGRFELPCRNGHQVASTRVSVVDRHPTYGRRKPRWDQDRLSVTRAGLSAASCLPDDFGTSPYRASEGFRAAKLGRESVLRVGSRCCACFYRGLHAPRRATTGRDRPVEANSGPIVKDERL